MNKQSHIAAAALLPALKGDQQQASCGAPASLTYVYRFVGYFQREALAVFDNGQDAINFAMANMSVSPNGVYVGDYAGDKPVGWLAAELSHRLPVMHTDGSGVGG